MKTYKQFKEQLSEATIASIAANRALQAGLRSAASSSKAASDWVNKLGKYSFDPTIERARAENARLTDVIKNTRQLAADVEQRAVAATKRIRQWVGGTVAAGAGAGIVGSLTNNDGSSSSLAQDKSKLEPKVPSPVDPGVVNAAISGDAPTRIVDTGNDSERNIGAHSTTNGSLTPNRPQRDRINKPVQYNKPEKRGMFGLTQSEYDEINKDVEKEHTRKLADIDAEEKKNQADIQAKYADIRKRTGLPSHSVKEEYYDLDEGRFLLGNIPKNFNPRTFADIGKEAKKVARNAWNSRDALGQEITDSIYKARKSIAGIAVGGGALGDYLTHKNEPKEKEYEKRSLTLPSDGNVSDNYDRNTPEPHSGYKDDSLDGNDDMDTNTDRTSSITGGNPKSNIQSAPNNKPSPIPNVPSRPPMFKKVKMEKGKGVFDTSHWEKKVMCTNQQWAIQQYQIKNLIDYQAELQ